MVSSNEADLGLFHRYTDLCNKLNLDSKTTTEAWRSYIKISENYTLEGDPMNWIACAIYVACWKSVTPTVGQNVVQGNFVNFTSLLRHTNLSLAHFFCNIHKWAEMTKMSTQFSIRIDNLEQTFAVAYNVFKDYGPMYLKVFKAPDASEIEQGKHKNRKQKSAPCTSLRVFEFCWVLFITIKGQNEMYANDLVASFNLLIAIVDWAFKNAFLADRRDLLNPNFKVLPEDWNNSSFVLPDQAPCIVSHLCASGTVTDVKYIKEYQFKDAIKSFFDQNVLIGKDDDNLDVFDASVFERNMKNITNTYETNILNRGEFDEKIFLAEYRRKLLEREQNNSEVQNAAKTTGESSTNAQTDKEMAVPKECLTPLTGRQYLTARDAHGASPIPATESTQFRLNTILVGCQASPSAYLVQMLSNCKNNPTERIATIVKNLGDKFVEAHKEQNKSPELTQQRLELATKLFYKRLENILDKEREQENKDISAIVQNDIFYECTFACCLEIVIHAYKGHEFFPWILNVLGIQSYNFVKVIELIIRTQGTFARETVKHLNMIEELILSSLMWKSDSIIWKAIGSSEQDIPKYEETALPGHLQTELNPTDHSIRNVVSTDSSRMLQSPGPSATDRFQSPVNHVNRELFPTGQVLQHLMYKDNTGVTRMIQLKVQPPTTPTPPSPRPRRTDSLSIIFRKFYNLAWTRMEHLCNNLKITETDMQRKIWTAFEELVRKNRCELIKDRDLDQLLMCAVYMIAKLTNSTGQTFAEIIKSYRTQPQAISDIYREVLITKKVVEDGPDGTKVEEQRGDLILFYNQVVIEAMKRFVRNFVDNGTVKPDVLLSPLPASRGQHVHVYGNICIKPLENPSMNLGGSGKVFNYYFNRSPSKDLNDINRAVRGNGVIGKRLLIGDSGDLPNPKRIATRKVQSMMEQRNQNTE